MTWDYRVVRTAEAAGESYAIYEVYYDDHGRPQTRTAEPVPPAGETLEELREDVRHYVAALERPVLDDTAFPAAGPWGAEGGADDGPARAPVP